MNKFYKERGKYDGTNNTKTLAAKEFHDKVFSGERISNEEIQESGDESEEQKPAEISGEQEKKEQEVKLEKTNNPINNNLKFFIIKNLLCESIILLKEVFVNIIFLIFTS